MRLAISSPTVAVRPGRRPRLQRESENCSSRAPSSNSVVWLLASMVGRPTMPLSMACRIEAVGAAARAEAATAVSRRVDEDLTTGSGVASPDSVGPDRRDEIDELADRDRGEAFVEPEPRSWSERKAPAAVRSRDDLCARDDLRDHRVEESDQVGTVRRGQDVEQPPAHDPAASEVVPTYGRVDAVLVEEAAQCIDVWETLRLGQIGIQRIGEVDRQDPRLTKPPHERHGKRSHQLTAYGSSESVSC